MATRRRFGWVGALVVLFCWMWSAPTLGAPAVERGPLVLGTGSMPIVEEKLHIIVDHQLAAATLRRVFRNDTGQRTQGQFVFKGGQATHVTGFAYWNGKQKIVGEVFEKAIAQQIYDDTVNRRKDPGLLKQRGEGVFDFSVFPIERRERKQVELKFEQWLPRSGETVELRRNLLSKSAHVSVELKNTGMIGKLRSPTHEITTRRTARGIRVDAKPRRGRGKEFILRWNVEEPDWKLKTFVHRDRGNDAFVVMSLAAPKLPGSARVSKDITLVIDRSGSMAGTPLEQAQEAAMNIVRRVGKGDRLNVILFDDSFDRLFVKPRLATEEVRGDALRFIRYADDGGGTDIALALEEALTSQHNDDRPKNVLFLTDGQSNASLALKVAEEDATDARVFTVGLGEGVERPLLARLAARKRGKFVFIENASAIEREVGSLYKSIETPVMVGLGLEVSGGTFVRQYPARLPDLFADDELVVAGRVRGTGKMTVRLIGDTKGGERTVTTTLSVPVATKRKWVGGMWARARIDHLLEEIALHGEVEELNQEVVSLGLAYNVVTPYTAFLAIPESELNGNTARLLDAARKQKSNARARHRGASALDMDVHGMADAAGSTSPSMAVMDEDDAPMLTSRRDSRRTKYKRSAHHERSAGRGGCAHCTVAGGSGTRGGLLGLLLLLLAARRRRR